MTANASLLSPLLTWLIVGFYLAAVVGQTAVAGHAFIQAGRLTPVQYATFASVAILGFVLAYAVNRYGPA